MLLLWGICSEIDLEIENDSRSNIEVVVKSECSSSCLIEKAMFGQHFIYSSNVCHDFINVYEMYIQADQIECQKSIDL